MSHTPGPWSVASFASNRLRVATTLLADHDITAREWGSTARVTEAKANAYLIAAAPSLLAAAQDLLEHDTGSEELATLRAAVRKARGEGSND